MRDVDRVNEWLEKRPKFLIGRLKAEGAGPGEPGRDPPLNAVELAELRAWAASDPMWPNEGTYTCDECADRAVCTFAFDAYNVGGDCLAGK